MSYTGFSESGDGHGILTTASSPNEQLVPDVPNPEDTLSPAILELLTPMVSKEDLVEEDYSPAAPEHFSSDYDPAEENTATSMEISPPPTPSHRSYRSHTSSTQFQKTPRKTKTIPSRKRLASPPTAKKPCRDYS
ncbi:unnamed protein product [Lactuca virosa]|uniref:Uncharacterized protein n=1 Tax=Lactuca virosa TaxID=75947 RepID=A0AAU9NKQ7_9ASTR|nr:unnamed protein product [Lactuca virosa]